MLTIIPSSKFTTIPWKNGLGKTVEMAISDGGTVDNFDWRISQATVANDGVFSDFSGLERNLVLIKGEGISLLHKASGADEHQDYCQQDHLTNLLDYANFDGSFQTFGKLTDGEIIDLNIMTASDKYLTQIVTAEHCQQLSLPKADLLFVYSLANGLAISETSQNISDGALVKITNSKASQYKVSGQQVIIAVLNRK